MMVGGIFAPGIMPYWEATPRVGFERAPGFRKSDKIFTLGSCFAREMRRAMRERGYDMHPNYNKLRLDMGQHAGKLPGVDNVHQYTPRAMLQELRQAKTGEWHDLFYLSKNGVSWHDPCRRGVWAETKESLIDLTNRLNALMREAWDRCNVVLLTFGLTETWVLNDRFVCGEKPIASATFFNDTDGDSVREVIEMCRGKRIYATVSPVALFRTATGMDVTVANMMSKSSLRVAVGRASGITYFPSYEFMMVNHGGWMPDRRHPTPDSISQIAEAFIAAHGE